MGHEYDEVIKNLTHFICSILFAKNQANNQAKPENQAKPKTKPRQKNQAKPKTKKKKQAKPPTFFGFQAKPHKFAGLPRSAADGKNIGITQWVRELSRPLIKSQH
jgi:hypothetical protein